MENQEIQKSLEKLLENKARINELKLENELQIKRLSLLKERIDNLVAEEKREEIETEDVDNIDDIK